MGMANDTISTIFRWGSEVLGEKHELRESLHCSARMHYSDRARKGSCLIYYPIEADGYGPLSWM